MANRSSSSGGVSNLRAMFEQNKKDSSLSTSPPDRGRSPAGSVGGGSSGTSPRPLSKVRTSFVAVERSGQLGTQWGLKRDTSNDGSMANRRKSFSIDEESDPEAFAKRRESITTEFIARKMSTAVTETIPESAIETPQMESEKRLGLPTDEAITNTSSAKSKPNGNSDKHTSAQRDLKNSTVSNGGFGGNSNGKLKPTTAKTTVKPAAVKTSTKPTPISITKTSTSSKPSPKLAKSPAAPRTPTTPQKSSVPTLKSGTGASSKPILPMQNRDQLSKAELKPTRHTTTTTAKTTTSISAKQTARPPTSLSSTTAAAKTVHQTSPSAFHKPKPKSPTRPAKLPSSMTAPTASSLSKINSGHPVTNRPSLGGATQSLASVSRSPSRASLAPSTELRRKASTINRDRPSLGRPSTQNLKKQTSRQSITRQPAAADDGFLARMMRPTTASASKTHEKAATSPKARQSGRPVTRDGTIQPKFDEGLNGSPSSQKSHLLPDTPKIVEPTEGSKKPDAEKPISPSYAEAETSETANLEEDQKQDIPEPEDETASAPETTSLTTTEEQPTPVEIPNVVDKPTEAALDSDIDNEEPEEPEEVAEAARVPEVDLVAAAQKESLKVEEPTEHTEDPASENEATAIAPVIESLESLDDTEATSKTSELTEAKPADSVPSEDELDNNTGVADVEAVESASTEETEMHFEEDKTTV